MRYLLLLVLSTGLICSQSALTPPTLGFIHDADHAIRPVAGVAGNFIVGDPLTTDVLSAAFSPSAGLVKTATQIVIFDSAGNATQAADVSDGPALFAFHANGQPSLAYLEKTGELLRFRASQFELTPVALEGAVLAISNERAIVQSGDDLLDLTFSLDSGVLSRTPLTGISAPVAITSQGLLFFRDGSVILRGKTGAETELPIAFTPERITPMTNQWFQITESGSTRLWTLHLTAASLDLFQLPEVSQ